MKIEKVRDELSNQIAKRLTRIKNISLAVTCDFVITSRMASNMSMSYVISRIFILTQLSSRLEKNWMIEKIGSKYMLYRESENDELLRLEINILNQMIIYLDYILAYQLEIIMNGDIWSTG